MADLSIQAGKIDLAKWKQLTPQEIIKEESAGEEVPAEIVAWAQQMAAFSKIPDNVTYEKVDGDVGLDALERLGIEDETALKPEAMNAEQPVETEEPDAVKDPARMEADEEVNENPFVAPDIVAEEVPPEEEPDDRELTLADPALNTDPNEIRKRKERKGILPA